MTTSFSISRRSLLGGALGAAAVAGLSACSPGSAGPPVRRPPSPAAAARRAMTALPSTLAFWNGLTGGDGPIMRKMIDEFNKPSTPTSRSA